MIERKTLITLAIFLVLVTFVFAREEIKQMNGDVKAPLLLKEAVEAVILANPEAGNRHLGWCGTPGAGYMYSFMMIFKTARTEDVIPFLEHRALYVRQAVHTILRERGIKAMPAIRRAYKNGSARIKIELLSYVDPKASDELKIQLLNELINDKKLKVFTDDSHFLPQSYRSCMTRPKSADDFPIDIVKFYLRMMETDFAPDKVEAIESLSRLGKLAAPVVPTLIEILKSEDNDLEYGGVYMMGFADVEGETFHSVVIRALGDIGPASAEAIPLIIQNTDTSKYYQNLNSVTSLYLIGHEKEKNLNFLINELNTQSDEKKLGAIFLNLGRLEINRELVLPRVTDLAKTGNERVRRSAIFYLRASDETTKIANKIILEGLKNKDKEYRLSTIELIPSFLSDPEIKEAMHEVLKDKDPEIKWAACKQLSSYDREKESLIPVIIDVINTDSTGVFAQDALDYLRGFKDVDLKPAIPGILNLIANGQDFETESNIKFLVEIGGTYDQAVNKLIESAKGDDEKISIAAMEQLAKLKKTAIVTLSQLHEIYLKRKDHVQQSAKKTINDIVESSDINSDIPSKTLVDLMDCLDYSNLDKLVVVLPKKNDVDSKMIKQIGAVTLNADSWNIEASMKILEAFGDKSLPAIPGVVRVFNTKFNYQAKETLKTVLQAVNEKTKGSVEDILPALTTKEAKTSQYAADAAFKLSGNHDAVVKKLIEVTSNGNRDQVRAAIETLGYIGNDAQPALDVLNKLAKSSDSLIASDSRRAVGNITKSLKNSDNVSLETLLKTLEVGTDRDRTAAANSIINATGEYQAVINRLGKLAQGKNKEENELAMWALGGLKTHQSEAILKLYEIHTKDLNDGNDFAGYQIKAMLQHYTPESGITKEVCLKVMESTTQEVIKYASEAYIKITNDWDGLVDRMIELLGSKNENIRSNACWILAVNAKHAKKALPVLEKMKASGMENKYNSLKYAIDEINRAN
jgi:HEAT repeat protein